MAKITNTKKMLEAIRRERKISGLTQWQVAEKCGMTRGNYSNIERGVYDVGIKTIEKITNAIGVDIHIYFERK